MGAARGERLVSPAAALGLARLVVPGWTGTYWIKHLTEIRIEPQASDGFWMKSAYRLPSESFPGIHFASQEAAETRPITELRVICRTCSTPVAPESSMRCAPA